MTGEVQTIVDQLVVIQKAITTPTGCKALHNAYDEMPAALGGFPCFVNVEEDMSVVARGPSRRDQHLVVKMHLLFTTADQKYSQRARRLWVQAVMDKFDVELQLNAEASYAHIDTVDFTPVELNGVGYIAATFELTAQYTAAFAFAAGV